MPIPLKEGIGGEREGDFTDYFNEKPKYKRFDDFKPNIKDLMIFIPDIF